MPQLCMYIKLFFHPLSYSLEQCFSFYLSCVQWCLMLFFTNLRTCKKQNRIQSLPIKVQHSLAYVFIGWLMVVIFYDSLFLESFAHGRCSCKHGGGRKEQAKTKVGRKLLPGFRKKLYANRFASRRWMAGYLFCGISADFMLFRSDIHCWPSFTKMPVVPHLVGEVLCVLFGASGTLDANYSPPKVPR